MYQNASNRKFYGIIDAYNAGLIKASKACKKCPIFDRLGREIGVLMGGGEEQSMLPGVGLFIAVLCCVACGGIGFMMGANFGSTKHYHYHQEPPQYEQREAENVEVHLPG